MSMTALRVLALAQLREQPARVLAGVIAIAFGVALGTAVYLLNSAALADFGQAARRLIGDADVIVRGPPVGFAEALFTRIAQDGGVAEASPVIELNVSVLPGSRPALKVLGIDAFRASALQPELVAALSGNITALFAHDAIVLSQDAANRYAVTRGGTLQIEAAGTRTALRVLDIVPADACPGALGIMDIGAAQWTLHRLGVIDRIDVRLRPGVSADAWRVHAAALLPAGVVSELPAAERGRAAAVTRAYRVNLTALALVALLTGSFVVFAVQWLSVLRRRTTLGLLRALGVTQSQLQRALLMEASCAGALGSLAGAGLGILLAALALRALGSDLGNGQLTALRASLQLNVVPLSGFILLGTLATVAGGALPAWLAARRPPASALKAGDAEEDRQHLHTTWPGLCLAAAGAALAWAPPVGGLPVPGYLAIACLLFGAVLLAPAASQRLIALLPRTGAVVADTAVAQLHGTLASSMVSLASIIVSFSLMVAMAIMVHSFRDSFDRWLIRLLPADLQLRAAPGSDTAEISLDEQQRLTTLEGITRIEFRRLQPLYLRAGQPPLALIVRTVVAEHAGDTLPLVAQPRSAAPPDVPPVWISEAVQDLYGYGTGSILDLPLNGKRHAFYVAGIWRDYVRSTGAVVIRRTDYVRLTGDQTASEASFWRAAGADEHELATRIRAVLGPQAPFELISSPELRERSLQAFDRAFLITYALEGVAVLLGLLGVAVAAGATALARRAQFGMLRHIGMLRRQVMWMFAIEGVALSGIAALYGLVVGTVLSLILVYVIDRQSFHWSIDLAMPWGQLLALSLALLLCAAVTALWSGRSALGIDPIRAVREDW
jgi:putative ABC transport system permease protein